AGPKLTEIVESFLTGFVRKFCAVRQVSKEKKKNIKEYFLITKKHPDSSRFPFQTQYQSQASFKERELKR
ncbi:MAG: hypothetical protein NZ867_04820, partial [SAR324 cluster bacterium]|nr:hypothetical protein [SAR324 cluster bacterium]